MGARLEKDPGETHFNASTTDQPWRPLRRVRLRRFANVLDAPGSAEAVKHDEEQGVPAGARTAHVIRLDHGGKVQFTPRLFACPPFQDVGAPVIVKGKQGAQEASKTVTRPGGVGTIEHS
jgi:hypothetical protein